MAKTRLKSKVADRSRSAFIAQARHRNVYIVEHHTGSGTEYRLWPPVVELTTGDEFRLVNTTRFPWRWRIHHSVAAVATRAPRKATWTGQVAARSRATVITLYASLPLRTYHYTVTSIDGGLTARGLSDPMIIIDPAP